jgi:hypothetical protein
MDRFNLFDPRYQLEAEDFAAASSSAAVPSPLHQGIHQALYALDALAERLRQREHAGRPPRH